MAAKWQLKEHTVVNYKPCELPVIYLNIQIYQRETLICKF